MACRRSIIARSRSFYQQRFSPSFAHISSRDREEMPAKSVSENPELRSRFLMSRNYGGSSLLSGNASRLMPYNVPAGYGLLLHRNFSKVPLDFGGVRYLFRWASIAVSFVDLHFVINELKADRKPLSWCGRMKIAFGIAQGLDFLPEKAPPIIYRDLKASSVLLAEYGLAKLLQGGSNPNISLRMVSSYGYCTPEYEMHGEVSVKADVYSFGVILLELITGRSSQRPTEEQALASYN